MPRCPPLRSRERGPVAPLPLLILSQRMMSLIGCFVGMLDAARLSSKRPLTGSPLVSRAKILWYPYTSESDIEQSTRHAWVVAVCPNSAAPAPRACRCSWRARGIHSSVGLVMVRPKCALLDERHSVTNRPLWVPERQLPGGSAAADKRALPAGGSRPGAATASTSA